MMPEICRLPALVILIALLTMSGGCGDGEAGQAQERVLLEENGSIQESDARDPGHNMLSYDTYSFEAGSMDRLRVEVETEGFSPLLKLFEVSTGAHLAEWDREYSETPCMTYTIVSPGSCELRVYSFDGGTGDYTLRVTASR